MPWVHRQGGIVSALTRWPNESTEFLDDAHPDVVAFLNPPPPTLTERVDRVFPQSDTGRGIFNAFFELENRVRTLESRPAITKAQLRTWFESQINGG